VQGRSFQAQLKCTGVFALAPCDMDHFKPAARGLLFSSFLGFLGAFLLSKRNSA
jgi:hypothetical protein